MQKADVVLFPKIYSLIAFYQRIVELCYVLFKCLSYKRNCKRKCVTIPVRQMRISVFNFVSVAKPQKFGFW